MYEPIVIIRPEYIGVFFALLLLIEKWKVC